MTELTYSKTGDYLIPDLELDSSDMQSLGRYGMLRESFLREHHRGTYTSMLLTGRLELHLREIDQQAKTSEPLQILLVLFIHRFGHCQNSHPLSV